jgi:hypothetical protein
MRKTFILILGSIITTQAISAQTKKNAQNLTPAQQLIANTGEDSLNSFSNGSRTVISGYGDLAYQRDFNEATSTIGLKRAVLFVGHQFNNRIAFFSELEVEDAKVSGGEPGGEVSMEQAYLKFSLNPRQYIVAGLFVPRIGITNENHLPINFNGVERPMVEQLIIPSTWRELGVGFYGQSATIPFTYCIALINGLNNAGFEHGTGFEGGRAEGRNAGANNLAVTAAVQYFAGNWKFQVSGYAGGTTPLKKAVADTLGLSAGSFGTPLYLAEADVQYNNNGLSFKALYCNVSIPEADKINSAYANNTPSAMMGFYGELGYNLLQKTKSKKWSSKQLVVFGRYEMLDMNAAIPSNGITDGTLQQSHIVAGFCYLPIPNVVIKADIRLMNTGAANPLITSLPYNQNNSFFNLGIGYSF